MEAALAAKSAAATRMRSRPRIGPGVLLSIALMAVASGCEAAMGEAYPPAHLDGNDSAHSEYCFRLWICRKAASGSHNLVDREALRKRMVLHEFKGSVRPGSLMPLGRKLDGCTIA
jgi:hypothetical protein